MIKEIQQVFSEQVLQQALPLFDISPNYIKDLGGFESFVYEFQRKDGSFILKITHTLRRTADYLMGELEWVNFLAENGVPTSRAIPSTHQRLIESIPAPNGHQFLVYAFEKAPGTLLTEAHWNNDLFYALGKVTGRMHRLTLQYQPTKKEYRRVDWTADDIWDLDKWLPKEDMVARKNINQLLDQLKQLPVTPSNYGLIHGDLHQSNFFIHQNQVHPFDFDDSQYDFLVNDAAITLYYLSRSKLVTESKKDFSNRFLDHYLKGYETEHHLSAEELKWIPEFLKLRAYLLYIVFHQAYDLNNITNPKLQHAFDRLKAITYGEQDVFS